MSKTSANENLLILAASEQDANLFYATKFIAPDDFCYLKIRGKTFLLMSDLEVDRARATAKTDEVLSLSMLAKAYKNKHGKRGTYLDLIELFARQEKTSRFTVPANFPLGYADELRRRGLTLTVRQDPFFPERLVKTPAEIKAIEQALRYTAAAVSEAIRTLQKSVIKKGRLYYHGDLVTSEKIKQVINVHLMQHGCIAAHSIVACGIQGVDPHNEGSGPLYAHQPIIMDIFPRDSHSRYFADLTRTVVRGKASPKFKKMYQAVKAAQDYAFKTLRPGIDSSEVHKNIQKQFETLGFKTGVMNGRMQGFFHSTGHGLGLDIHELPRISMMPDIMRPGHVVTVEPGLYYADAGGVRLEDVALITKTGCRNLTKLARVMEI